MRKLKIAAAMLAFSSIVGGVASIGAPAQAATQSDVQADWRQLALDELTLLNSDIAGGCDVDHLGLGTFAQSFQARLIAFKYDTAGGYNNTSSQSALNEVLGMKVSHGVTSQFKKSGSGYGIGELDANCNPVATDAFNDGSQNDPNTIYTVTLADHVGPMLLDAYDQGAVSGSEVQFVVDALMNQPTQDFTLPDGRGPFKCMLYSDNANDEGYCVNNVTLGAAAFLQRAYDDGFQSPGQLTLINDLKAFPQATFGVTTAGWWPYALSDHDHYQGSVFLPKGYWSSTNTSSPWFNKEDWNHAAYTAESAQYLGMAEADTAYHAMLDNPNYTPGLTENQGRDVFGRIRAQAIHPTWGTENLWRDAQFWVNNYSEATDKNASEHAQFGFWAARMAGVSDAAAETAFTTTFLATPRIYLSSADAAPGVDKTYGGLITPGSKVYIGGTVRTHGSSTMILRKPVQFWDGALTGQIDVTKLSGLNGNFTWVVTAPTGHGVQKCYRFRVPEDGNYTSNQQCFTTS